MYLLFNFYIMGMRSTFNYQEIHRLNNEKLLEIKNKNEGDFYYNVIDGRGDLDFNEWDGDKLQGYWYDECVECLQNIAKYADCEAVFTDEEGDKFKIILENGNVFLSEPEFVWLEKNRKELIIS